VLARRRLAHHARRRNLLEVGRGGAQRLWRRATPTAHARHAPTGRFWSRLTAGARRSAGLALAVASRNRRTSVLALSVLLLAALTVGFLVGVAPSGSQAPGGPHRSTHAAGRAHHGRAATATFADDHGNAGFRQLGAGSANLDLARATTPPAATPAALAAQPPLAARENFAFAPYWTLPESSGFSLTGLSTLAYFSIDVNANGTLDESGPGWDGFESQDLATLISRAHAAGERVVLTVTDFDQGSLDSITSSPTAANTLSSALIPLLEEKSLDGVNFDFEGEGSGDQTGLTDLIAAVSGSLRAADPHWQITMDTYASSAGDPNGFYDIAALGPYVDAFFVMDYELNLKGTPSASSPLTSTEFSSLTTLQQYTAAVPASKVILGLPFFGIDWPTDNGTMAATAAGGATDIADSQAETNGPEYWDPVTDTAWTSYQVGSQWHESYYEGEYGLYQAAQLASLYGVRGVGIWALGMEGDGAGAVAAMDGFSPGGPPGAGPQSTSSSPATGTPAPGTPGAPAPAPGSAPAPAPVAAAAPTSHPAAPGGTGPTSGPAPAAPTTTSTTAAPSITALRSGVTVDLTPVAASQVVRLAPAGTVTDFQTNVPSFECLDGATLTVDDNLTGHPVAVAAAPADCVTQDFLLPS
jgi:hypothetical protein